MGLKVLGTVQHTGHYLKSHTVDKDGLQTATYEAKYYNLSGFPPYNDSPSPPFGNAIMTGSGEKDDDGVWTMTWTFRGGDPAEEGGGGGMVVYEGSMAESPITMHRNFGALFRQYGDKWEDGVPKWKNRIEGGGKKGLDMSSGEVVDDVNPMYGITSFLEARGRKQEIYTIASEGAAGGNFLSGAGKLQGGMLFAGIDATTKGGLMEVRKVWLEGNWLKDLYE